MNKSLPSVQKWGIAAEAGFQSVPDLLLKHQRDLHLTSVEMVVLINITMHWWYADQRPFPRSSVIAKRMGVEVRTVQRALRRLGELGLVKKVIEHAGTEEEREVCDLSGLVDRLGNYAPDDPDYIRRRESKRQLDEGRV